MNRQAHNSKTKTEIRNAIFRAYYFLKNIMSELTGLAGETGFTRNYCNPDRWEKLQKDDTPQEFINRLADQYDRSVLFKIKSYQSGTGTPQNGM